MQRFAAVHESLSTYLFTTNLVLLINTKTVFSAILRSEIIRQNVYITIKSFSKRPKSEFKDEKEITPDRNQERKESTETG